MSTSNLILPPGFPDQDPDGEAVSEALADKVTRRIAEQITAEAESQHQRFADPDGNASKESVAAMNRAYRAMKQAHRTLEGIEARKQQAEDAFMSAYAKWVAAADVVAKESQDGNAGH